MEALLQHGAEPNARSVSKMGRFSSPLLVLCGGGGGGGDGLPLVRRPLECGADALAVSDERTGDFSLAAACQRGDATVEAALLG